MKKSFLSVLAALALLLAPTLALAAANTTPIFSKAGMIQTGITIATAATAKDGTTATLLFTGDATNGSRCEKVVFQPIGTNIGTVARIFINNGSAVGTAANNTYFTDATLAASTLSEVISMPSTTLQLDVVLPAGYRLYVSIGTTVAAGYAVTPVCGSY
jgi:hypothetical protein